MIAFTPWQSSHFGYYNNNAVIDMRNRSIYKDDVISLKTLDKQGKLKIITVPGIPHSGVFRFATQVFPGIILFLVVY